MSYRIDKSALVWHSAEQMFGLVNDIRRYPEFLPWCAGTEIHEESLSEIIASLEVAKGGIRQRLTTRNRLLEPAKIEMALVDGPFQNLRGHWDFLALDEYACKVMLKLEFQFSGSLSRMTFGPVFNQAANTLVDAFCKRADSLYGGQRR